MTVLPCKQAPLSTSAVSAQASLPGSVTLRASLRPRGRYNSQCYVTRSRSSVCRTRLCMPWKHPWCCSRNVGSADSTAKTETSGKHRPTGGRGDFPQSPLRWGNTRHRSLGAFGTSVWCFFLSSTTVNVTFVEDYWSLHGPIVLREYTMSRNAMLVIAPRD